MGLDVSHVIPSSDTSEDGLLEYFTLDELSASPDYTERHKHLIFEKEEEEGTVNVIYFKEVGLQKKGMSSKFYKDFENGKPYFDLATVEKASKYLRADHINSWKNCSRTVRRTSLTILSKVKAFFMQVGECRAYNIMFLKQRLDCIVREWLRLAK